MHCIVSVVAYRIQHAHAKWKIAKNGGPCLVSAGALKGCHHDVHVSTLAGRQRIMSTDTFVLLASLLTNTRDDDESRSHRTRKVNASIVDTPQLPKGNDPRH